MEPSSVELKVKLGERFAIVPVGPVRICVSGGVVSEGTVKARPSGVASTFVAAS